MSDRRVELADMETVTNHVQDLRCLLGKSSLAERRSFIKSFVKEVNVKDTEVLLTYTMPLANKVAINEELGVPSIVQYGGQYRTIDRTFKLTFPLIPS